MGLLAELYFVFMLFYWFFFIFCFTLFF